MSQFTKDDMVYLSQWERPMQTAIESNYLRNVGRPVVQAIIEIWSRYLGEKVVVNDSCPSCILDLLKRVGHAYFAQKFEPKPKTKKTRK